MVHKCYELLLLRMNFFPNLTFAFVKNIVMFLILLRHDLCVCVCVCETFMCIAHASD